MMQNGKHLVDKIMRSTYQTVETPAYTKYFNDEIEILAKKNIISLILDKRKKPVCMYTDINVAMDRLSNLR